MSSVRNWRDKMKLMKVEIYDDRFNKNQLDYVYQVEVKEEKK